MIIDLILSHSARNFITKALTLNFIGWWIKFYILTILLGRVLTCFFMQYSASSFRVSSIIRPSILSACLTHLVLPLKSQLGPRRIRIIFWLLRHAWWYIITFSFIKPVKATDWDDRSQQNDSLKQTDWQTDRLTDADWQTTSDWIWMYILWHALYCTSGSVQPVLIDMNHIHHASEVEESYSIQALRALRKFISSLGVLGDTLYRLRGSANMYIYSFFFRKQWLYLFEAFGLESCAVHFTISCGHFVKVQ